MELQNKNNKKGKIIYWLSPIIVAIFQPIIYYMLMMIVEDIDATRYFLHIHYYLQSAEMARSLVMVTVFCTFPGLLYTAIPNYAYLYFLIVTKGKEV